MKKQLNFKRTPNFSHLEQEILEFWRDNNTFQQSLTQREKCEHFSFYDGPPFATGLPHYGHLMQSIIKDLIPRYQTMKGKYVRRVWGWDCHGLPIENIIEKDLGLADKQAIEDYGVDKFNQACQNTVLTYTEDWKKTIERIGRWIDMDHAYKTMDMSYMESVWWVFKQLYDQGLIYQSHKPMHICPRCSTPLSNFEVTQGYQDVKDLSVTAKFKVLHASEPTYFLAWTTTPWTLPGNLFLALNPELEYALVQSEEENFYLAAARVEAVFKDQDYQVLKTLKGEELLGLAYEPVFPYFADLRQDDSLPVGVKELVFTLQAGDFVTLDEGTGIVHIAPAFGEDDYNLGEKLLAFSRLSLSDKNKLFIQHVGMDGRFKDSVTDFAGLEVKPKANPQATDVEIIRYLAKRELLFSKEKITHSYPHCWRCDTPLLNYAANSWFVRVTDFKEQLLENNEQINWQPEHIKHGRFGKWLEGARDWAISRNRFWGTPLPLWQADNGDLICVGSASELEELSGQKVTDLHKQVIDEMTIEKDGQVYHRVSEVLDCWFESGSMPYGQLHYPFENKELFENTFPADFISEGQDQTRGWFYTLHVLATALKQQPAFKNIMCTGLIMAADGKKMSKRLKNYPEPGEILEKYGADSLRLYLMTSPAVKAETLNFDEQDVANLRRRVFLIWWNVLAFYQTFAKQEAGFWSLDSEKEPSHILDRWILAKLKLLSSELTDNLDGFDVMRASRLLAPFINDLSTWYLRLSRDRIKDSDNSEVSQVFATVLYTLAQLFAPVTPFFSELIHQVLVDEASSIHLTDYPELPDNWAQADLLASMDELRQVVELGHSERKRVEMPLRQALAGVTLSKKISFSDDKALLELLKQELNVKELIFSTTETEELSLSYDLELTPALKAEGRARELIRQIQGWRREAGLAIEDQVEVSLTAWPAAWQSEIEAKTNSVLISGETEGLQK